MIALLVFSGKVSDLIEKDPTVKILALAFLIMIGFALIAESFHLNAEKACIYFNLILIFSTYADFI